ncbi:MAG: fatty acid desaturase [Verrucomicrobiota bacterium]
MKAKLLDSPTLRTWTKVHPYRNLAWLSLDYLTAAALIAGTLYFWYHSAAWGLHFAWNIVVGIVSVLLVGAIQHRIGLMGHEASHYMLHPNRKANDILAELLCFFPIFGTLTQYRAKHISHHLYPNDPDRDMNMNGTRAKKLYARFPMPKPSFIYNYYIKFFWPPFVIYNLSDLLRVVTIGSGLSPIPEEEQNEAGGEIKHRPFYKNATMWGIAYMFLFIAAIHLSQWHGLTVFFTTLAIVYALGVIGWKILPDAWFQRPGGKLGHSLRFSGFLRLTFVSLLLTALGLTHTLTGTWAGGYFLLLWILPLIYVFPYLMLLREIFQHANADQGELTNSRVMNADPFTHWALLGYGNDAHLVHHIYPNIPQYHLRDAHEKMLEVAPDYQRLAEETYGTFAASKDNHRAILDSLAAPSKEQDAPAS